MRSVFMCPPRPRGPHHCAPDYKKDGSLEFHEFDEAGLKALFHIMLLVGRLRAVSGPIFETPGFSSDVKSKLQRLMARCRLILPKKLTQPPPPGSSGA
jgi:hypothetical protein